jgi:hypothetical protein
VALGASWIGAALRWIVGNDKEVVGSCGRQLSSAGGRGGQVRPRIVMRAIE